MADTPDESSQDSTCQRAYDHNPEVGPGVAAEEGGAEGAGRVYGAVVDRNTHYVHQAEGKTDATPARFELPTFEVAPRTMNTKKKVSRISVSRAMYHVAPG